VLVVNQGSKLGNRHFGSRKNLDRPFVGDTWRRSKATRVLDIREIGVNTPPEILKGRMLGFNLGR
jgi:hypothetical protein